MFTEVLLTIIICVLIAFLFFFIWRDNKSSSQMTLPIIYLTEISTKKIKPEIELLKQEVKEEKVKEEKVKEDIKEDVKEDIKKEVIKEEIKKDEEIKEDKEIEDEI